MMRTVSEIGTRLIRACVSSAGRLLAAALLLPVCACLPGAAGAAQTARLSAALTPERLGAGTTIAFGFTVASTTGQVPSPLIGVDLLYPANLGIGTSGLGLATCDAQTLEVLGPEGCPSESQMGYGAALVEVPFGPVTLQETAITKVFMAHIRDGHLGLIFYASGVVPVDAQIIFPGLVLPARNPYGGDLATTIPLVPTLPGAPYASVVKLSTTLGPAHLTYYERTHGKYIPYHPRGIVLPRTCPRGGFKFAARFNFHDATHAAARTSVPCPRRG
ncbi:MAG: hypothetical protein ACHQE6_00300 [Solirubrobacterales bacterium]